MRCPGRMPAGLSVLMAIPVITVAVAMISIVIAVVSIAIPMVTVAITIISIAVVAIAVAMGAIAVPGTAVRVAAPATSPPTPTPTPATPAPAPGKTPAEPPPQPKAEAEVSIIWIIAVWIIRSTEVIIDWLGGGKNHGITRVRGSGSNQLCLCWRCWSRLSLSHCRRAGRRLCCCRRTWLCVHQRNQNAGRQTLRPKVDDLGGSQVNARGVVNELDDDVLVHLGL
jgi:hypothetical protein